MTCSSTVCNGTFIICVAVTKLTMVSRSTESEIVFENIDTTTGLYDVYMPCALGSGDAACKTQLHAGEGEFFTSQTSRHTTLGLDERQMCSACAA